MRSYRGMHCPADPDSRSRYGSRMWSETNRNSWADRDASNTAVRREPRCQEHRDGTLPPSGAPLPLDRFIIGGLSNPHLSLKILPSRTPADPGGSLWVYSRLQVWRR